MTSPALIFPPTDHSLLLPDLIDFHIEKNPTFPAFVYANEGAPHTLTEISFLEFGRAAHRVAHALRPCRQGSDGEVVMIIANTDTILYQAIVAGLFIAGWAPFPTSPRNPAEAIVDMLNKTHCSRIVTLDHAHKTLIDSIHRINKDAELTVLELPTLHYAFPKLGHEVDADPFARYPPSLKRPDPDSVAMYSHSSGSTGFPKPIPHTLRNQLHWVARPSIQGYAECPYPRRVGAMALPPFHMFGVCFQLYIPLAFVVTSLVYAPRTGDNLSAQPTIPTSDNMIECLKRVPSNTLVTVPAPLAQMATSEESVEILKRLDHILFSGGPLPVKAHDTLTAAGVKLVTAFGGTECGLMAGINKENMTEGYLAWMGFPDELNIRWVPQGDDTYELQLLTTDTDGPAIENLPDVRGYATSDLFVKHPTKNLWKIVGRVDDVITLASGEKTVPPPMESIIGSSPLVQCVVMFGRGRNQVGVLIEPSPAYAIDVYNKTAVAEFRNLIWPKIEEANNSSPAFSRIFKEMILITSSDRPMRRTPKGTVQRKTTLNDYEKEINALYDDVEASSVADGLTGPLTWTRAVLEGWLLEHACAIKPNSTVDPNVDLFAQGFDSLSATYMRNRIMGALRKSSDPEIKKIANHVPPNVVFENPTIQLLSSRVAALVAGGDASQVHDSIEQHERAINAMIEKYSVGLDGPADGVLPSCQLIDPAVVLLTGSTGGLGSLLLSELLKNPAVQRVFAFNRPSSAMSIEERQRSAFVDKGIPTDVLGSNKLVYIEADSSLEKCGLSVVEYDEIRNSVTLIIHNAWRLDFNLAIASFENLILGSKNLIDLGLSSRNKLNLRFLFTSSIGSAQSWDNAKGPFPEDVQLEPSAAVGLGYGESKYVTERIVVKSGLHATSLRIGQIVGGLGGAWATTDWFPILVKSSTVLGVLPDLSGVVSWIRDEDVARATLEIAFAEESPPPALNIVNPRGVPWTEIVTSVRRSIIKRKVLGGDDLPVVPYGVWLELLEKKAENALGDDLKEIPAIKLVEFFRAFAKGDQARNPSSITEEVAGMAKFSTAKAQHISPTMASMQAVGEVEADAWVEYWISKGPF